MELARDYGLSLADLDEWDLDDLLNLVFDVHRRCTDPQQPDYRIKRR